MIFLIIFDELFWICYNFVRYQNHHNSNKIIFLKLYKMKMTKMKVILIIEKKFLDLIYFSIYISNNRIDVEMNHIYYWKKNVYFIH